MNIDKIVLFFGGNFDKQNNIMIVDNTNKTYEIFKNTMEKEETIIDTGLKYKITKIDDEKNTFKKANLTCIQGKKMIRYSYIKQDTFCAFRALLR